MDEHGKRKDRMVLGSLLLCFLVVVIIIVITIFLYSKIREKLGKQAMFVFMLIIVLISLYYTLEKPKSQSFSDR